MIRKIVQICYEGAFPRSILINGIPFNRNGGRYCYQSMKKLNNNMAENIIYIEVLSKRDLRKTTPSKIKINGRVFVNRFGPFFTPKNLTEREVGEFFDSIALTYEQNILPALNKRVIYYLIRPIIHKRINLVDRLRILDFGTGSGLSIEVAKKKFQSIPLVLYGLDLPPLIVPLVKLESTE